jgi:multidrug efflux pump subunit AcrB
VFVPLIFLSGIAGALFYDQAIAVASGLAASLVVSITLIPTLYHLIHVKPATGKVKSSFAHCRCSGSKMPITVDSTLSLNSAGWLWRVLYCCC